MLFSFSYNACQLKKCVLWSTQCRQHSLMWRIPSNNRKHSWRQASRCTRVRVFTFLLSLACHRGCTCSCANKIIITIMKLTKCYCSGDKATSSSREDKIQNACQCGSAGPRRRSEGGEMLGRSRDLSTGSKSALSPLISLRQLWRWMDCGGMFGIEGPVGNVSVEVDIIVSRLHWSVDGNHAIKAMAVHYLAWERISTAARDISVLSVRSRLLLGLHRNLIPARLSSLQL